MDRRFVPIVTALTALALLLAACNEQPAPANEAPVSAVQAAQSIAEPQPTALPLNEPVARARGVSGLGAVVAVQDANLFFAVSGTVAEVLVEEGATVEKDQVLAVLDLRPFDQQVRQAEAALAQAQAQRTGLDEQPRAADLTAARAQIASGQAALERINAGPKEQDVESTRASVEAAQANLQSTRDQLSFAKTQADAQVENAAQSLVQAQAAYARAKSDWDFVQDTGNNPQNPSSVNPLTGQRTDNKVNNAQREQFYAAFVQAEAALRQAEQGVEQARIAAEEARKSEVVGIQAAEQQVVQAEQSLNRLLLPPEIDQVAAAQAQIAGAQAQLDALNAPPRDSAVAQASAGIAQAEASLELARLNREFAELRAPFDGVIAAVNIAPGDPSAGGGQPAIAIVDVSTLRVEVSINDIDIGQVRENQAVSVLIDALPGQELTGRISYIAPTATVSGNIRTYLVRVTLDDQEGLRAGMSARVEIPAEPSGEN